MARIAIDDEWLFPPIEPLIAMMEDENRTVIDLLGNQTLFKFVKDKNAEVTN